MKSIKLLSMSLIVSIFLVACSSDKQSEENSASDELKAVNDDLQVENNDLKEQIASLEEENEELKIVVESNSETVEDTEASKSSSDDSGKSRSTPSSIGDNISYEFITYDDDSESIPGKATLTINEVIRGDEAISIIDTNSLPLEELPEGYEWAVFDFTVNINEVEDPDESVYVWGTDFDIYEEDGSQAPSDIFKSFDGRYMDDELYEGGSTSGKLERVVPVGEPFQIRYGDGFTAEELFISVE